MSKILSQHFQVIIFGLLSLIFIFSCGKPDYGNRLQFGRDELYYTKNVTVSEALRLGEYLVKEDFFTGEQKSVQLDKHINTYQIRLPIKKGIENDLEFIQIFKQFAKELSENVFNGAKVDIHLCNDKFETIRVVVPL